MDQQPTGNGGLIAAMAQEASVWNDGNVLYLNCKVLIIQLYKYIKYLAPQMKGGREKNGRKKRRGRGEKERRRRHKGRKLHFLQIFLLIKW